jgi:DNA-binding NtrC family response regulator
LDEIGDMPLHTQAKLLRVLQEREIQRLGSSESISLDVRVIAATNQDLAQKVAAGTFREDLFYRLNVVPLRVAPLRERLGDVPLLVHHFIEKVCRREGLPPRSVSRETLKRLGECVWPGNVRQLENAVEMAVLLAGDRQELYPGDFPLPAASLRETSRPVPAACAVPSEGLDFERTISGLERSLLEHALQRTGGNKKLAAELLGLKRTTLSAKLKSLQMAT